MVILGFDIGAALMPDVSLLETVVRGVVMYISIFVLLRVILRGRTSKVTRSPVPLRRAVMARSRVASTSSKTSRPACSTMISPSSAPRSRTSRPRTLPLPEVPMLRGSARSGCQPAVATEASVMPGAPGSKALRPA